jgi:hypothetical protein
MHGRRDRARRDRASPCLNKADLPQLVAPADVQAILGAVPIVEVSAIKSDGLKDLSSAIGGVVFGA